MLSLFNLISEFQNLKALTGTSKTSSFEIGFAFDPWRDAVTVTWGSYDIPGYPRTHITNTTRDYLTAHLRCEIDAMSQAITQHKADQSLELSLAAEK